MASAVDLALCIAEVLRTERALNLQIYIFTTAFNIKLGLTLLISL